METDPLALPKAAIDHFKDWSNFLLVTTVAILGWVAEKKTRMNETARKFCLAFFSLSVIFAILTLALIPLVTENLKAGVSIFEVPVSFRWLWIVDRPLGEGYTLKWACWPQHVFFLLGILAFTVGSWKSQTQQAPPVNVSMPSSLFALQWVGITLTIIAASAIIYVQASAETDQAPMMLYWIMLLVGVVAAITGFVIGRRPRPT